MSPKIVAQTVSVCEDSFYIFAAQSASRPQRVLKHNDTFAVFDDHGDIGILTGRH